MSVQVSKTVRRWALVACLGALPAVAAEKSNGGGEAEGPALRLKALQDQGVAVAKVERRRIGETVSATAEIAFNEQGRAVVAARVGGWVERVAVFANQRVKKDQLLLEIYSPDFLSAQNEYLLIRERVARAGDQDRELLAAAEQRLKILGLTDDEIRKLAETRAPYPMQHIHSPIGGTVIEHKLAAGDTVEPGQVLYLIAALDTVWAHIDLTEATLGKVRAGQPVSLTVEAYPGRRFRGQLLSLGAAVMEATRTVRARAVVTNSGGLLKPGMFARAEIGTGGGPVELTVPDEAVVLFKGAPTVFKVEGDELHPQQIEVGERRGGVAIVKGGLAVGDRIAVKGTYLLKSLLLKSEMGEGHGH